MIKTGVDLRGLQPQMVLAYVLIREVYGRHGYTCTITSGSDGKHGPESLHYKGCALDIRTRDVLPDTLGVMVLEIKQALGGQFDVVLEKDHLHVEFDPKDGPIDPSDR